MYEVGTLKQLKKAVGEIKANIKKGDLSHVVYLQRNYPQFNQDDIHYVLVQAKAVPAPVKTSIDELNVLLKIKTNLRNQLQKQFDEIRTSNKGDPTLNYLSLISLKDRIAQLNTEIYNIERDIGGHKFWLYFLIACVISVVAGAISGWVKYYG